MEDKQQRCRVEGGGNGGESGEKVRRGDYRGRN